ncbi:MAG: hypothetical protein KUG79_08980 [Pseudomonadales bacterium]|nr:hypothetical protein [Pseudomonadales bacterium]
MGQLKLANNKHFVLLVLATLSGGLSADETISTNPIVDCLKINPAEARLHCFEEQAKKLQATMLQQPAVNDEHDEQIVSNRASPATDAARTKTKPATSWRNRFGFGFRSAPDEKKVRTEKKDTIKLIITDAHEMLNGQYKLNMSNGEIWHVVDTDRVQLSGKNLAAIIRGGTFGSYFLSVEGQAYQVRVRRVK